MAEHGFAALVTFTSGHTSESLLFDAGLSKHGLMHNMDVLEVRPEELHTIVLSQESGAAKVGAAVLVGRQILTQRQGDPRASAMRIGERANGAILIAMSRAVALTLLLLAVLAPPLAMMTAHCLAGDCQGFCVSAVAPAPTMIPAITAVTSATADPAAGLLTVSLRLSEPPPRSLHTTV